MCYRFIIVSSGKLENVRSLRGRILEMIEEAKHLNDPENNVEKGELSPNELI